MKSQRPIFVIKILLALALVVTAWQGLAKTPEYLTRFNRAQFENELLSSGKDAVTLKQSIYDQNLYIIKALEAQLHDLQNGLPSPGPLVTKESLESAIMKITAINMRSRAYLDLANEKLERAQALVDSGFVMPLFGCPATSPLEKERAK